MHDRRRVSFLSCCSPPALVSSLASTATGNSESPNSVASRLHRTDWRTVDWTHTCSSARARARSFVPLGRAPRLRGDRLRHRSAHESRVCETYRCAAIRVRRQGGLLCCAVRDCCNRTISAPSEGSCCFRCCRFCKEINRATSRRSPGCSRHVVNSRLACQRGQEQPWPLALCRHSALTRRGQGSRGGRGACLGQRHVFTS